MHAPSRLRWFLVAIACAIIAAPIAFIVTLVLMPLWSWIESATGVESVGHSGPASWCFWVVYAGITAGLAYMLRRSAIKQQTADRG